MKSKFALALIFLTLLALLLAACATPQDAGPQQNPDAQPSPQAEGGPPPDAEGQGPPNPEFGGPPEGKGGRPGGPGGPGGFLEIISEGTGLDVETIRKQTSEGATLAEIVTANGGDLEEIKAKVVEAMGQMPDADQTDIEQRVNDMFSSPLPMFGPGEGQGPGQGPGPRPEKGQAPGPAPNQPAEEE
jgi:hypothetical protein